MLVYTYVYYNSYTNFPQVALCAIFFLSCRNLSITAGVNIDLCFSGKTLAAKIDVYYTICPFKITIGAEVD